MRVSGVGEETRVQPTWRHLVRQAIPLPPFPCRLVFFHSVEPITPSVIQRLGFLPFFAFDRTAAA